MPETYNECKDRFGIIFHDKLTVSIYKIYIHIIWTMLIILTNFLCYFINHTGSEGKNN